MGGRSGFSERAASTSPSPEGSWNAASSVLKEERDIADAQAAILKQGRANRSDLIENLAERRALLGQPAGRVRRLTASTVAAASSVRTDCRVLDQQAADACAHGAGARPFASAQRILEPVADNRRKCRIGIAWTCRVGCARLIELEPAANERP